MADRTARCGHQLSCTSCSGEDGAIGRWRACAYACGHCSRATALAYPRPRLHRSRVAQRWAVSCLYAGLLGPRQPTVDLTRLRATQIRK